MPDYTVRQGDCISLIARRFGFANGDPIVNHPRNHDLFQHRKNANVLYPGDKLFIPDPAPKYQPAPTAARHRYRVAFPKRKIEVIIQDALDRVIAGAEYTLSVAGQEIRGSTDGSGKLKADVPADASTGHLFIGGYAWELRLGHLNPIEHTPDEGVSGILHRLMNLGYSVPETATRLEDRVKHALAAFQARVGITVSGILDDATRHHLEQHHEQGSQQSGGTLGTKPAAPPPPPPQTPPHQTSGSDGGTSDYQTAQDTLACFYQWDDDRFQSTDAPNVHTERTGGGLQRPAPVATNTTNVLGAACACFVCTLKLLVAQKSFDNLKHVKDSTASATNADKSHVLEPPARAEDLLTWFHDEPFEMNIVGLRRKHSFDNEFDDRIISFFRCGVDRGDNAWTKLQQRYSIPSQDWLLGSGQSVTSKFVACKRFGGWWVTMGHGSTDPGWEEDHHNDNNNVQMSVLDEEDGTTVDAKYKIKSGEAFLVPYWYKRCWRVGAHHKTKASGHAALKQVGHLLIERLYNPKTTTTIESGKWVRIYRQGQVAQEFPNATYNLNNHQVAIPGSQAVTLQDDDVIGIRHWGSGFGINIHRGHNYPTTGNDPSHGNKVGSKNGVAWSEGCQVWQSSADFDPFLRQVLLTKWVHCSGKPADQCGPFKDEDQFKNHGFTVATQSLFQRYHRDNVGFCDETASNSSSCDVRFDYVLVELPASDLQKIDTDYGNLSSNVTFQNGNKLFLGGEAVQPQSAPPAPAATPPTTNTGDRLTHFCGNLNDPLFRDAQETPVTPQQLVESIERVWRAMIGAPQSDGLLEDVALVLCGQWGNETGWGKKMMNYNFGNVKRGSAAIKYTAFTTNEQYGHESDRDHALNCPLHSEAGPHKGQRWLAIFHPPHVQTHFRAYDSLDEGVRAHYDFLTSHSNFTSAWNLLKAHANGTGANVNVAVRHDRLQALGLAYGNALHAGGYATDANYPHALQLCATTAWHKVKPAEYQAWHGTQQPTLNVKH